jgi:hypothetical protein
MVSTLTTASPSSISRDLKAFLVVQQLSKRDDNAIDYDASIHQLGDCALLPETRSAFCESTISFLGIEQHTKIVNHTLTKTGSVLGEQTRIEVKRIYLPDHGLRSGITVIETFAKFSPLHKSLPLQHL